MISVKHIPDVNPADLQNQSIGRAETIPPEWYTDPRFHEFDQNAIFARSWQGIGHVSRLAAPGDQVIGNVADNPIIVVKGDDGLTRAFYNVCRHRGGPIAIEDCNAAMLQCKYHGWTYRLDGSLRGTPKFNYVELFDKRDFGLVPVPIGTWEGLVFVNLEPDTVTLEEMTDGIRERIGPVSLSTKKFFRRVTYNLHCNWKVYVDNYLEGYHLPFIHPELCNVLDIQNYTTETFEHYSLQHSPLRQSDTGYGAGDGSAWYFYVWPNFMMNILPGRLQTNLVVPTSHNHTMVLFDYYYDDVTSPESLKRIEADISYSDAVQKEDIDICERVHAGLRSRAYTKGRLSVEMERGVHHFQSMLKQAYSRALETATRQISRTSK